MRLQLNKEQYEVVTNLLNINEHKIHEIVDSDTELSSINIFNSIKNNLNMHMVNNIYYIYGNKTDFDDLREIVANYLMISNSFDEQNNPTKLGFIIESLIDLFYIK